MLRLHPFFRFAALAAASACLQAASSYQLVDLGPGSATAINSSGRIVGNSPTGAWVHDGTNRTPLVLSMRPIGGSSEMTITQQLTSAFAISDNGHIAGSYSFVAAPGTDTATGVVYPGSGVATLLSVGKYAYGVNSSGTAVGLAFTYDGTSETLLPGVTPILYGINDAGVAVGSVSVATGPVPARFSGGEWTPLNLSGLPQVNLIPWTGEARAINGNGASVGSVYLARQRPLDPRYAFINANGVSTLVEGLGGLQSIALGLNDSGVVVGTSEDSSRAWHAFVNEAGVTSDLNGKLSSGGEGWLLTEARGVNTSGLIVGTGVKAGQNRAFLLLPTGTTLPPSITQQPVDTSVFVGETFSLSVLGSGAGSLSYQWQRAGTNLPDAHATTFTRANSALDDAGEYRVIVYNGAGSITSAVARVEIKVRPELSLLRFAGVSIRGIVGKSYRIEASDAPSGEWIGVKTLTLATSPTVWIDEDSANRANRIYRVVEVP